MSSSERNQTGVERIAATRQRQIDVKGYTPKEDLRYTTGELLDAARAYLDRAPHLWPWDPDFYSPSPADRIHELEKAGALIAAEIDRLTTAKES